MDESRCHDLSIFVTLTYSDENLPSGSTLVKAHFQSFMKRLRSFHGAPIRYYHCGEYGETTNRPHYHALLFGIDFADKKKHSVNPQGQTLYKSETLEKLWGFGHCLIGQVTFETAAYTARYCVKKINGEKQAEAYRMVDLETGETFERIPPYSTMSLKPGIGAKHYDAYATSFFPRDSAICRGKETPVPRYYFRRLEAVDPKAAKAIKAKRIRKAATPERKADSTPERLLVRKTVREAKISLLSRKL